MVLLLASKLCELSPSILKVVNAQVLNYWKISHYPSWKKACLKWGHRKCFYFLIWLRIFFCFTKRISRWYSNWQLRTAFPQVSVKKAGWEWFHKFTHHSGSTQHTAGMCCESRRYYTGEYCLLLRYLLALARSDSLSASPLQLWRHWPSGDAVQSVHGGVTGKSRPIRELLLTEKSSMMTGVTCECCSYLTRARVV